MDAKVVDGSEVRKPQKSKLSFTIPFFIFQAVLYTGISCAFGHTEHRILITYSFIQLPPICIARIY